MAMFTIDVSVSIGNITSIVKSKKKSSVSMIQTYYFST